MKDKLVQKKSNLLKHVMPNSIFLSRMLNNNHANNPYQTWRTTKPKSK